MAEQIGTVGSIEHKTKIKDGTPYAYVIIDGTKYIAGTKIYSRVQSVKNGDKVKFDWKGSDKDPTAKFLTFIGVTSSAPSTSVAQHEETHQANDESMVVDMYIRYSGDWLSTATFTKPITMDAFVDNVGTMVEKLMVVRKKLLNAPKVDGDSSDPTEGE